MIPWVSAAWKEHLRNPASFYADGGHLERFYIELRHSPRPPLPGHNLAFTLITSGDNQPGSHNLTSGHADYLVTLEAPTTVHVRLKPTFAYNVGTDQPVWAWRVDATHTLVLAYSQALDKFVVSWQDGGTARVLLQDTAYTSDGQLQQWTDIDVVFGPSPALAINGTVVDSTWSGSVDTFTSAFCRFSLRHDGAGNEGGYTINHVRVFLGLAASAAAISSRYKGVLDEEIHWPLDGHGLARTRCNITERVLHLTYTAEAEKEKTGYASANTIELTLDNRGGIFSDDQYAAFDPSLQQYNGTSDQRYLQRRSALTMESWYGALHEPIFVGRLDEGLFKRRTGLDGSEVRISAEDLPAELDRVDLPSGVVYQNKKFSDATEADSLIHLITRLGSKHKLENFLANSSFELATIANAWAVSGTGATFSRVAGGLLGSYQGDLVYGSANCSVEQTIEFLEDTKLNVGEWYLFAIRGYAAAAASVDVVLEERDASAANSSTTSAFSVGASGFGTLYVAHQVVDSTSDRLRVRVTLKTNTTLHLDVAMLHRGRELIEWGVVNATDGAAAAISADDVAEDTYDTHGFDVDAVADVHPFVRVTRPWDELLKLTDASMAFVLGADHAGTLRFRSPFKTGFTDPTPVSVLSSTWDLATELSQKQANTIIVGGVRIVTDASPVQVWSAAEANDSDIWEAPFGKVVLDGLVWPHPLVYPEFWAKYDIGIVSDGFRYVVDGPGVAVRSVLNRNSRAANEVELLAVTEAALSHSAQAQPRGALEQLTVVAFDPDTKVDQARIQLRNDLGHDTHLARCTVRGKRTLQYSGSQGYTHDRFVDHDAIRRDGVIKFELENNWIISADLTARCADYMYKDQRTKKHEYSFPLAGASGYHLQVGDWHTVQIGEAGHREYIDSTARLLRVVVERDWNTPGTTQVTLREVEQNWTHDSGYAARGVVSGRWPLGRTGVVVVASSSYAGPADYYCDGTADDVEIQAALDEAEALGKMVATTPGTYNLTAGLLVAGTLLLHSLSILSCTGPEDMITFAAAGAVVKDGQIVNADTVNRTKWAVDFGGFANCRVEGCSIDFRKAQGILCDGDNCKIIDNTCQGGKPSDVFSLLDTATFTTNAAIASKVARLDDTHYVVVYRDSSDSNIGKAVIVTVDADGQATPGTPTALPSAINGTAIDVKTLDSTHFLVAYCVVTTNYLKATVGVVSNGDEIAFSGSEYTVASAASSFPAISMQDATRAVILSNETGTGYGVGYVATWTTPTTLAFGAKQTWRSGATYGIQCDPISSTTLLVAYYDAATGRSAAVLTANLGTGSISAGTAVLFHSSAAASDCFDIAVMRAGAAIVIYQDNTDSSKGKLKVLTINGTSVTADGASVQFTADALASGLTCAVARLDDDQAVLVFGNSTDNSTEAVTARIYGTTASTTAAHVLYADDDASYGHAALIAGGRFAVAFTSSTGGTAEDGITVMFEISVAPDSIQVSGDNNLIHGNHVLGISGYTQGVAFHVAGSDNKVADNIVDGLVGADRLIEGGVVIAPGSVRAVIGGNVLKNCATKGCLDAGDDTLLDGTNRAYNNGADTGVSTF